METPKRRKATAAQAKTPHGQKQLAQINAAEPAQPAAKRVEVEMKWSCKWTQDGTAGALEVPPSLGKSPVPLQVAVGPSASGSDSLAAALRSLYQRSECCDVVILCSGRRFPCHRPVLAACSPVFAEGLRDAVSFAGEKQEVRLVEVSNPEAVRYMLDFMYEVDPTDNKCHWRSMEVLEITKDVLRLANRFQLPGLTHLAAKFLAKDITTGNVVERLAICEEHGLAALRDAVIAQLATNRAALQEVAHSKQITEHPELMRAILQATAASGDESAPSSASRKRGRAASSR